MTNTQSREWSPSRQVNGDPEAGSPSPTLQYDRALGQFIVAQRLAPSHHVQEYWTAGIYQSCRLATALIQYQILDAATLENALSQFQNNYLFCSRCPVTLKCRKNHYSRCPSCQSPWFEDSGWSSTVQVPEPHSLPPTPLVDSEPDEESSEEARYEDSADQEESWLSQTRASLLSHLPLFALMVIAWSFFVPYGRASIGHKEFDFLAHVFLKGTGCVFAYLLAVKGCLQLLGREVRLFLLFSGFALTYGAMYVIQSLADKGTAFTLFFCCFLPLSLMTWPFLWDEKSQKRVGALRGGVLFVLVQVAPAVFIGLRFAVHNSLLWWLAR